MIYKPQSTDLKIINGVKNFSELRAHPEKSVCTRLLACAVFYVIHEKMDK